MVKHAGVFQSAQTLAGNNPFLKHSLQAGAQLAVELFGPFKEIDLPENQYDFGPAHKVLSGESPTISKKELQGMHRQLMSRPQWFYSSARRMATPGDLDFRAFALPPSCRWLYWLLRPMRQLKR